MKQNENKKNEIELYWNKIVMGFKHFEKKYQNFKLFHYILMMAQNTPPWDWLKINKILSVGRNNWKH